jgi:hypothetical protein
MRDVAMKSPFEVAGVPSIAGTGSAAPSVMAASTVDGQAGGDGDGAEEFVINPRLTLVFRDVWVADIPIAESLAHKARRRALGLCQKDCPQGSDFSYIDSGTVDCSSSSSRFGSRQEEMYAKLEAAAASGAFFIVPGVSSRFPHSQLHAIMGPSGCGECGEGGQGEPKVKAEGAAKQTGKAEGQGRAGAEAERMIDRASAHCVD